MCFAKIPITAKEPKEDKGMNSIRKMTAAVIALVMLLGAIPTAYAMNFWCPDEGLSHNWGATEWRGICGTVVFFSVLLSLLHAAGLLSPLDDSALLSALLCGALELTGGISRLPNTLSPMSAAAASFLLGWGGLCVHMQTLSVLTGSGIPVKRYFLGKALHGSIGAVLAYLLFSRPGISLPASFPGQTHIPLPNMFFYSAPLLLFLLLCIFRKKAGKTGTQRL